MKKEPQTIKVGGSAKRQAAKGAEAIPASRQYGFAFVPFAPLHIQYSDGGIIP